MLCLVIAAVTSLAGTKARADEQQYLLLMNRFGEICTMCEAVVLCADGDVSAVTVADLGSPGTGPFTLYHFQTKTFWGQVATIWSYLRRWVEPIIREERPVRHLHRRHRRNWGANRSLEERMARLSIDPPLIEVGRSPHQPQDQHLGDARGPGCWLLHAVAYQGRPRLREGPCAVAGDFSRIGGREFANDERDFE